MSVWELTDRVIKNHINNFIKKNKKNIFLDIKKKFMTLNIIP